MYSQNVPSTPPCTVAQSPHHHSAWKSFLENASKWWQIEIFAKYVYIWSFFLILSECFSIQSGGSGVKENQKCEKWAKMCLNACKLIHEYVYCGLRWCMPQWCDNSDIVLRASIVRFKNLVTLRTTSELIDFRAENEMTYKSSPMCVFSASIVWFMNSAVLRTKCKVAIF